MVPDLKSYDFRRKGWTKAKLAEVAMQFNIDLGSAATFHQVRAILIDHQHNPPETAATPDIFHEMSSTGNIVEPPSRSVRTLKGHYVGDVSFEDDEIVSHAASVSSALDAQDDHFPNILPPDYFTASAIDPRNPLHCKSSQPQASKRIESCGTTNSRTIPIKLSVFEECRSICANVGIENPDMAALNFLCERSLPPDFHDKNDDDQSKACNAANRAMGVVMGEPYFPQDLDVMQRSLKTTVSGDHVICEHPDFPSRGSYSQTNDPSESDSKSSLEDNLPEIRTLWLRFPIFQSLYSPYRNEIIEFVVDSNESKMMVDVDRTVRSLMCINETCGLSKRNDKVNAYYLLNSLGDVVLLNSGLLRRCPLKTDVEKEGGKTMREPLYVCLYDKVKPGENSPMPAVLKTREWKYVFPHPELCKCLFLLMMCAFISPNIAWTQIKSCAGVNNAQQWSCFLYEGFNVSEMMSSNPLTRSVMILEDLGGFSKMSLFVDSLVALLVSPFVSGAEKYHVDCKLFLYFLAAYFLYILIKARSKYCVFNLAWYGINRFWYLPSDLGRFFSIFNLSRGKFGANTGGLFLSYSESQTETDGAMMRVQYEEKNIVRFLIYRWVATKNCDEDFECWSSTLRAALGISTSSQNDPDMLVSDPKSSGVRIALSSSFLKHTQYKNRTVFKISKPGTFSKGLNGYFYTPYLPLAFMLWIWFDALLPYYDVVTATGSILSWRSYVLSTLYVFIYRNTLSSVLIDLVNVEPGNCPWWAGYYFNLPCIISICIGVVFW